MTRPLDLDAIEARAAACFIGPWRAETWTVECPGCDDGDDCGDDHEMDTIISPDYPGQQVVAQVDRETGEISTPGLQRFAEKHAAFIAHARVDVPALVARVRELEAERIAAIARAERAEAELNNPQTADFVRAVVVEAAHQRQRWGTAHDAGKSPADWFWLLGYLGGKALRDDGDEKRLHRIIATAAVCANWYLHASGADHRMRPGIDPPAGEP